MEKIVKLRNYFKNYNLDGYIIPKNDEFFNEYTPSNKDRLNYISNFSGSFGLALILKKKNFQHRLPILILTNLRDKVGKNICRCCLVQKGPKNI